jgi:hypothetical protein
MTTRPVVALVLGVVIMAGAACSGAPAATRPDRTPSATTAPPSPPPEVDTAATPAGWVAVDDGDAQLSVPADWFVTVSGCVAANAPGTIVLVPPGSAANAAGRVPSVCPLAPTGAAAAGDTVTVGPITTSVPVDAPPPSVLNGIVVDLAGQTACAASGPCLTWYVVPSLGLEIVDDEIPGQKTPVIDTLTDSPRAVVLAPGRPSPVPVGWHRVTFGGISAAVPASWSVQTTSNWSTGCAPFHGVMTETEVTFNRGATDIEPSCPAEFPGGQTVEAPGDGLLIDPGTYGPLDPDTTFGSCLAVHGLRVCPSTSDDDGILVAAVHLGRTGPPVAVEIGLGGGGRTARTILHSLRAG